MEQFIRAKYEQKKWIAKDWTPGSVTVSADVTMKIWIFQKVFIKTYYLLDSSIKLKEDTEAVKEKRKSNNSKIALASTVVDSSKPIKTTKPMNPPNFSNDLKEIKPSIDNSLPLVDFGTESNWILSFLFQNEKICK